MNQELLDLVARRIATGLKRNAITKCSEWAEQYRVMGQPYPGKWTFDHHPWLREMHDAKDIYVIGQKAAQVGFTETALNKVFYTVDIKALSCLYILPASNPDAHDFSSSRFEPALEMSPHLQNLFTDTKNVGHKRAGSANLFIRGSRSRSQLKSIPASLITFDEIDEMVKENVVLALERTSGQTEYQFFLLSTPRIEGRGINAFFQQSSQDHFYFNCPHCGRKTELIFPESLVVTANSINDPDISRSHLICKECKGIIDHANKPTIFKSGVWIPSFTNMDYRGFYINQFYSPSTACHPVQLAKASIRATLNATDEQEFYNSKLGLCHTVDGARLTPEDITACTKTYKRYSVPPQGAFVTMGIDVGKWIHYEIDQWFLGNVTDMNDMDINLSVACKMLTHGKVEHFEQLDNIMRQFHVNFCVIDAQPERRKALEFAQRFWGKVKLNFYVQMGSKVISIHPDDEHTISTDRTTWMDLALNRFRTRTIELPMDTDIEYQSQVIEPVRLYIVDKDGNPIGRYVSEKDDHYAMARTYSEIALKMAAQLGGGSEDIV